MGTIRRVEAYRTEPKSGNSTLCRLWEAHQRPEMTFRTLCASGSLRVQFSFAVMGRSWQPVPRRDGVRPPRRRPPAARITAARLPTP